MSSESGPASIVKPSTCSLKTTPPARDPASRRTNGTARRWSSKAADNPATPPPTMITGATSSRRAAVASHVAAYQIFQHRDERRRRVQRFGPPQSGATALSGGARLHVDVEEDLGVIADEPDRRDEEFADARGRSVADDIADVGADPWLGCPARALIRDLKARQAGARGDCLRGGPDFVDVRVAAVDDALRQAVRGEDHLGLRAGPGAVEAFGECLHEERMRVKRLNRNELHAVAHPGRRRAVVLGDAQRRELRGQ